MPHAYEVMRDKFAKGAAVDSPAYNAAQSKAAAIYNSKHPGNPMHGADVKRKTKGTKADPDGIPGNFDDNLPPRKKRPPLHTK